MTARIAGIGAYVPENLITNDDLAKIVDTNDEWIRTRTGIRERRISSGEGTRHLAAKAAERALAAAGVAPEELDIIILGTSSPDRNYPSDACSVQAAIGAVNAVAFDISAACAGFIFAMNIVEGFFKAGIYKTALIIGAEVISRTVDYTDRGTCILFGDGAGAAVAVASADKLTADWGASGDREVLSAGQLLPDGSRTPLAMNGKEVFRFAVSTVPKSINRLLEKAGVPLSDVDHIVCHQANHRIVEGIAKHLHTDLSRFYENIEFYGNTSAASIPIALCDMQEQELLHRGERMVLAGFGSGLTWGSVLMNW